MTEETAEKRLQRSGGSDDRRILADETVKGPRQRGGETRVDEHPRRRHGEQIASPAERWLRKLEDAAHRFLNGRR